MLTSKIVLIRGVPGSGKSTKAKNMVGYVHLEADMFFYDNGCYVFDSSKVKAAHDWCEASVKIELEKGNSVVVSNTFIKVWEMKRYVDLGFPFSVIEMSGKWQNVHGVSLEKIEMMKNRMEKIPSTWKVIKLCS
jgi:predicted kinase